MIKKLDGLLETVDYESSFSFMVHHNTESESYPKHWHGAVEIIMPLKNPYKVIMNDASYTLNEYDIFIVPSGDLHELNACTDAGERIILQFELSLFKAIDGFLNSSYIFLKPSLITPDKTPDLHSGIKTILLDILEEYDLKNNYYEAEIITKILGLAITMARMQTLDENSDSDFFIRKKEHLINFNKCIEYIGEHYKEDLTLDYISSIAGFSKYHFLRWFKQYAKMTFNDYLLQVRLKAAESLLMDFNIPITEVALEAGFQSITTFNRVFKKNKKCTPTEYRNYNRNAKSMESANSSRSKSDPEKNAKVIVKNASETFVLPSARPETSLPLPPAGKAVSPVIWSDIPDPDVIRVGDVYYMASTTMHFNPGCPIMKSNDLINWEIIGYVYDILEYSDAFALKNGKSSYGEGSWAASLRYNGGMFYVSFVSYTSRKTYIYRTHDIETGNWEKRSIDGIYHDMSLLFDDDGRVYMVYGGGAVKIIELTADASGVKENGLNKTIIQNANIGSVTGKYRLNSEGSHIYKINGYYYIFLITWTEKGDDRRIELCYRSDEIDGNYEGLVVFNGNIGYENAGAAQGGIVDTADGKWYAMLFQDRKSVGRCPVLIPVSWQSGWPVFEYKEKPLLPNNPKVSEVSGFVSSDEFYGNDSGYLYAAAEQKTETGVERASKAGYLNDIKNLNLEIIENNDFENGLSSWDSHQSANLSLKNDGNSEGCVLYVSGRTDTTSGPRQTITGKIKRGEKFKVSARIKYVSGPPEHVFNLTIRNGKSWRGTFIMCSGRLTRGEWGVIEGVYTLPMNSDISETFIFIESIWSDSPSKEDDLMNFYVSNVSMVKKHLVSFRGAIEGEYDSNGSSLAPCWQWNHNPDNNYWSLTERAGYLRLTAGTVCGSLSEARNSLTQRTFGPECSGTVAIETSGMKNGDVAGLAAFQKAYAYIAVKMTGNKKYIITADADTDNLGGSGGIALPQERVYLKADFTFYDPASEHREEKVCFYYSLDGIRWNVFGGDYPISYTIPHFTGYRFALFNFAREITGGYVDFDYFRADDKLTVNSEPPEILKAYFNCPPEVKGIINTEFELKIEMESLLNIKCGGVYLSVYIPELLEVVGVEFNKDNILCDTKFSLKNNRLELCICRNAERNAQSDTVKDTAVFVNKSSNLFAAVRLKVKRCVSEDAEVCFKPDYIYIDGSGAVYDISETAALAVLKYAEINAGAKKTGCLNPLINHKYGADPCALVYKDRLYIYLTSDAYEYNEKGVITDNTYGGIKSITVISTSDLANWTDHGEINAAGEKGAAKWANHSWAPAVAYKNIGGQDKFFLYFANDASNIGVLVSNSPIGPWTDPIGKPLVNRETGGVEGVTWRFAPAVLVDGDGTGYLYCGGGLPSDITGDVLHPKTARVIKLGGDMTSTDGDAVTIDAPAFFEDSGIHKLNGKYYYSYCSNFAGTHPEGYPPHGEIAYMVSDSPMGPFKYIGPILKNPEHFFGVAGNNHHAIFEFKNKWYITYHTMTRGKALGIVKGYRSPHINEIEFYSNGNIRDIKADMKGAEQLCPLNPYEKTGAETFAWCSGISTQIPLGGKKNKLCVTEVRNSSWLAVSRADFGENGASSFNVRANSLGGGIIELHLDSRDGEIIGILRINANEKAWSIKSCGVNKVTGIHHIFFVFKGGEGDILFNLDYWYFE